MHYQITMHTMYIHVLHREVWSDAAGDYVPTDEIIGYRAYSGDGQVFGYGESVREAEDCLRRILWRPKVASAQNSPETKEDFVSVGKLLKLQGICTHYVSKTSRPIENKN